MLHFQKWCLYWNIYSNLHKLETKLSSVFSIILKTDLYFYRYWAVAGAQLPSQPATSINRWAASCSRDGLKPMIVSSQVTVMDD